jgi:hypothetical protein
MQKCPGGTGFYTRKETPVVPTEISLDFPQVFHEITDPLTNQLFTNRLEVEVEVNLRPTISRTVCLGVRRPSGTSDQFFFLLEISFRQLHVFYFVAPYLTRGRVCNLLYNCFWALPEQSLLSRSPTELNDNILLSHLRIPQPREPGSRIYVSQE